MTSRISIILTALLAAVLFCNSDSFAGPFPLNFNLDSLQKADKQPATFKDHVIAFKGTVTQYKQLSDGLPYFLVQLPTPNPKNEGLWVKGFSNAKPGDIAVGHMVVVLGYFEPTDAKDKDISAIHKKAYHVIGICVANGTTQMGIYAKEGNSVCLDWQNGRLPSQTAINEAKAKVVSPTDKKP